MVARSWKYHRPRGILSAGVEEPNALVQLFDGARTVPNARMTEVPLVQGLSARPIHAEPSIDFDWRAVNNWFSRFLPAGFYYKTFMASQKALARFLNTTSARPAAWASRRPRTIPIVTNAALTTTAMCSSWVVASPA